MINISDRIYGIDLILKKENKRILVTLLRLSGSPFTVLLYVIRCPLGFVELLAPVKFSTLSFSKNFTG